MKKQRGFLWIVITMLLLFVAVSVFVFYRSSSLINEGYLKSEGDAAENFAVLTAENIHLTNAQVDKLKAMSYAQLMASEENRQLRDMMDNDSFAHKVDYAYIMVHLKDSEVKYSVTEENQDRYDAPVGTKLDIMWLLDVNVSEETSEQQQSSWDDDFQRYSYYIDQDAVIFGEAPTNIYNSSEWGDHICGYAPVYTTEGRYIGVIGVELEVGSYKAYCGQAIWAMGILMTTTLLLLSLMFLYIYCRNRKMQLDRIYLDGLTQVYNRSYYTNLFTKKMNAKRSTGCFALMITDVDWFKKVNDTFGHEAGDEVLIELGKILCQSFGKEHVVRFGGEEFVIGLWTGGEEELKAKLDALYKQIAQQRFSASEITLTVSLGCVYHETTQLNGWLLSGMLRAADCKLYQAKESGRKRYFVEKYDENVEYRKNVPAQGSKHEEG